jgi:hypothetical protein
MTNHLEWHNHAFLDETNIVISVNVFDESAHDSQLLEDIRTSLGAKQVVCCCEFGQAGVGYTFINDEFRPIQPYPSWSWDSSLKIWKPPVPMPEDGTLYHWDNDTETWVETVFETRQ